MGRKSNYTIEEKLQAVKDYKNGLKGIAQICLELGMSKSAAHSGSIVRRWVEKYEKYGESAFLHKSENQSYTKEFKFRAVQEYLEGNGSINDLCNKYDIPATSTLLKWIKDYNSHIELEDYIPGGKEIYMAKSRKVTKEERIEIAKYCINHDLDYVSTAKLYNTTYANVFNWVKKFQKNGEEGLGDKRGRHKKDEEVDETTLLRRQLKQMEHERDMALLEVKLLKKLDEIERRRFTERANMKQNMKQSKK